MKIVLHLWLFITVSTTLAIKDPPLPPCPTHLQFFPQSLPMHCRMPRSADPSQFPDLPQYPTLPPLPESFYQSPPPDKQARPIPIPIPPFPGIPGAMPMPGPMGPMGPMGPPMPPGPMPGPMPGGPMPMPMPMVGGPPHKLPVIVMPFYSPDNSFKKQPTPRPRHRHGKKRRPRKKRPNSHESDVDDTSSGEGGSGSDSDDSSEHGFWKGHGKGARRTMIRKSGNKKRTRRKQSKNKKKELLTPILQYVTKDGYVIFEKQISKSEAKDWLKPPHAEVNVIDEKQDDKFNEVKPKSAENYPKIFDENLHMRAEDKSKEAEATTQQNTKVRLRHRPRKINPLLKENM